jgi:hypothetical protein
MGLRVGMVVLIWLVLLLQSSMVAADEGDDDASTDCFAEPVGIGECGLNINATAEPTNATFFTARFGIPTNKKSGNGTTTTVTVGYHESNTAGMPGRCWRIITA